MLWIISAPTRLAGMENRPPFRDVPPIATARIASISIKRPALLQSAPLMPALSIRPATAAITPQKV